MGVLPEGAAKVSINLLREERTMAGTTRKTPAKSAAKSGTDASSTDGDKYALLESIVDSLKKGGCKKESFYMTMEDGQLTLGWISEDPGERRTHQTRTLNLGERVHIANVQQSIEASLK